MQAFGFGRMQQRGNKVAACTVSLQMNMLMKVAGRQTLWTCAPHNRLHSATLLFYNGSVNSMLQCSAHEGTINSAGMCSG